MEGASSAVKIIYFAITACVVVLLILIAIVAYVVWQNKKRADGELVPGGEKNKEGGNAKSQGIVPMTKFLAFDEIVDNMIVRKKGEEYVMVIQCKGVNFDLLGEDEKLSVEAGFVEFLNMLRFPIQLYIQTRRLNLTANIDKYSQRMRDLNERLRELDIQIKRETASGRDDVVKKLEFDRRRLSNILEYGNDVTSYVSRLSQNRNVLQQNTYIVVSYYKSEIGVDTKNYSKSEIDNIAFSELYTRAQTLIRGIASTGVVGRVLNSEELAELLYIAYNRDDSELVSVRKSVEAQYDSLYSTAKDIIEKQKENIERSIDEEAINLTTRSIKRADKIRRLRKEHQEEIKRRAAQYADAYRYDMSEELYKETKRQIEKADLLATKKKSTSKATAEKKTATNK